MSFKVYLHFSVVILKFACFGVYLVGYDLRISTVLLLQWCSAAMVLLTNSLDLQLAFHTIFYVRYVILIHSVSFRSSNLKFIFAFLVGFIMVSRWLMCWPHGLVHCLWSSRLRSVK
jgi:hypothetical protein